MANICSFQGIIIGTMKEIRAFMHAATQEYDYDLNTDIFQEVQALRNGYTTSKYPKHV